MSLMVRGGRRAGLLASTLLASVAAVPVAVGLLAAALPQVASAQDYTSGTLLGRVTDDRGAPVVGASATVKSQATGVQQTSTTDATGTFRAPLIPSGAYTVTLSKDGFATTSESDLGVRASGESAYAFTLSAAGSVSEVVVTAKKAQPQLDFSQATQGVTVDVEQLQKQLPIARNLAAVVLLAPGVTLAVPGFTNTDGSAVPSIGGGSAGENAFYLNGLNITNFDTYIGGATVPFDFYKSVEVKTGGYPAEFGRATGGVINAVSKVGTNDLYVALHGNYQLNELRETAPNTYGTANAATRVDTAQTNIEVGGALIPNHLFAYGLYQLNQSVTESAGNLTGQFTKTRNNSPFYGIKLDGYLTSRQHFEFTQFSSAQTNTSRVFGYTASPNNYFSPINGASYINGGDDVGVKGSEFTGVKTKSGGNNWVAKYTGTFTDWFTISGAYGRNHDESFTLPGAAGAAYVTDGRANGTAVRFGPTPSSAQTTNLDTTYREFYRVDADLYANFFGRHHFRVGFDNEDTELSHSSIRSGIGNVLYSRVRTAAQATTLGLPLNQEYVRINFATLGGGGAFVDGVNQSEYLQDSWDVNGRLNLQVGVRNDDFQIKNLRGETSTELDGNVAGRFAASYDPFGNKTDKVSFSYGRYFIPPASNTSFRGADLLGNAYYLPPGGGLSYTPFINGPLNTPTLGAPITPTVSTAFTNANRSGTLCPVGTPTPGTRNCTINGDGSQEPAASKTAVDLDASYEDEFILSYEKKLSNLWTVNAAFTFRQLGTTSEDVAIDSALLKYCARNLTVAGCNDPGLGDIFGGDTDYVLLNPGRDTTVKVRTDLPTPLAGKNILLTKADLQNPAASREYYAFTVGFQRAFDGKWSLAGSYTLSRLVGNYEGTVKSDAGNGAQVDAGATQDFDHPGLEEYAYGFLPNHRAHEIKLYGSYQLLHDLSIGANLQVTSPRQFGCLGFYPSTGTQLNDPFASGYGASSHYCVGADGVSRPSQRASVFEGDWFTQFDVQVRYTVPKFTKWMPGNLQLRADVFNLFNQQQVVQYDEVGDSAAGQRSGTYQLPLSYQTPRFVRLGFDLVF